MSGLSDLFPNGRPSGALIASVAAVGVSAYAVALGVGAILGAATSPSIDLESADPLAKVGEDSSAFFETSRKRFDGRSVFSLPQPPVRRARIPDPPPRPVVETPKDPPKPVIPASYTGPAVTGVLGNRVFFASFSVNLGESQNGVTVIEINAPWLVKLGHKGGEYEVPLLARPDEKFLRPAGPPSGALASDSGAGPSGTAGSTGTRTSVSGARPSTPRPSGSGTTRPTGANRPPVVVPGDEPGADVPSGPGPDGSEQSPAMQPQRLSDPNRGGGSGADGGGDGAQDEPASSNDGEEFVDRSLLPPPLSDAQIAAMTIPQARAAIDAIDDTNGWNVDDHSRARMNWERQRLIDRINRTP